MLKTLFLPAAALLLSSCAAPLAQTSRENTSAMVEQKPLTIERLFASPGLSGPTPSGIQYSPDGKRVTFLKAREEDGSRYDLWQFDVATGEQSMLVDSQLLEPEDVELSEEETRAALALFNDNPRSELATETPEEIKAWADEVRRAVEGRLPAPNFLTDAEIEAIKARFNVARARL